MPEANGEAGIILAVDGQPDGTVARKRFWRGNFLYATDPGLGGPGFKRFRPIVRATAGGLRRLSNDEIARLAELIKAIGARGIGVLLVEHHADLIFDICDYVTVLNLGRTLAAGTPAESRVHKEVVSAYRGG